MSSDQAAMDPSSGFSVQPGNGAESKTSPPAFLDLADSAARFNGDMNSRVEHKRVEHERQRAAQRRVFEEQMRALEQQQIAEEHALLSQNSSPKGTDHQHGGHRGQGNFTSAADGIHHHHLGMPSFNMNMGMALSAPTTPPLASDYHPSANDHAGGIYDVVGVSQAIRAAVQNGFGGGTGSPAGGMTSNGMTTPTTNSAQSNPFDNNSNAFSSVIGTPSTHVSPTNRKSVNITPSPEIMQGGGMHQLMQHNLGHFSAGLVPVNSSPGMGSMGYGGNSNGNGNGHGNNGNGGGGGAYGHGAKSMPASRRASAGSKDGGGTGDDLLQGLRGLGLGEDGMTSADERHGNGGNSRVPGSIVTAGAAGRHAPGPFTSTSAFGHSAFLFDTELDDEMQNSLNTLPAAAEADRFTNLRSSNSINFNLGGGAATAPDPYTRKLSVSSAALDLAPLSQTPPRSSFLASRAGGMQHHSGYPAGASSEWPQFNPPRPISGTGGSGAGGLLPSNGVGTLNGGSAGLAMYRNGGAMTMGNATPTASGAVTPSYPLKAAANVREGGNGAGRLTPSGLSSISQHISNAATTGNLGRAMGQSPEGRGSAESPSGGAARFLVSDTSSSASGSANGGVVLGAGYIGAGARSVPATPLSGISGSNLGMSLLKTQPIGPISPANGHDIMPNYASDLTSGTPYNSNGRGAANMAGTPTGMYEPVAYGSISGGNSGVNEDDAIYGNGNVPVQQQQYDGVDGGYGASANAGGGMYGGVYQTLAPNGMSVGAAAVGMSIGGPMTNAFVPGALNKTQNGGGFGGGSRGPSASQFQHHGQNRSISYNGQGNGRFGHGHQPQAGGASALASARIGGQGGAGGGGNSGGFGGGDSKMGGLHGPKHKRSDIDREYNRYTGTRLEDLVGELSTLCKDQHGCRYLQKKLEENNPEYRDIIFRETFPHFAELMTDPFGNYLCQKLLEFSTDEQRSSICQSVAQDLVQISLNMHGTRAVQKMIDFLSTSRQTDQRYDAQIHAIILALSMHVVTLIKDLNGNHVVQKCLNKLAAEDNQVVQYILDLNDNRFSDGVIRQFFGNVCALSVQKFSSNVIEKCIRVAEQGTRKLLVDEFLNRSRLEKLLRDSYGNYCVQTALDYAEPDQRRALVDGIRPILPLIRNTPYGKRIQSKLQREQMEAAHQYGGMQGYRHPPNHPNLMNMGLGNNGHQHHTHGHVTQSRHVSQPSLHHTGGIMDHYGNQSQMYSHAIPPGYNGQSHLHAMTAPGFQAHPMLHRQGSGGSSSLMGDAAYPAVPPYSTPLTTGYSLPPGDHYHPGYAYGV
ncbi:hypothetical protein FRB98_005227 [Tulasnella sp. 332]|nr:hypothetical protein FRB98_005227 [Tulasnella sp. 332]